MKKLVAASSPLRGRARVRRERGRAPARQLHRQPLRPDRAVRRRSSTSSTCWTWPRSRPSRPSPRSTRRARPPTARRSPASIARHVDVTVGGRPVRSDARLKHVLAFPPGQAGLRTTRLEVLLASPPLAHGGQLVYHDRNYAGPDRLEGDRRPGRARRARVAGSSAPSSSVSDELLSYPKNLLQSPLDVTEATAQLAPGDRRQARRRR